MGRCGGRDASGLTQNMKRYIELRLAYPHMRQGEIAKELGVGECCISNWKKDPLFVQEFDRRLKEHFFDARTSAIETITNLCEEGDFQASKYVLDCSGYNINKQQIEVSTPQGFTINITGADDGNS